MIKTGLVSITFRKLSPRQIVDLTVQAGLDGIEWGGDIHVPHGQFDIARQVEEMTRSAGLEVAAYGSYYRVAASEENGLSFGLVLETARLLGAPLIRVWPGNRASAEADPAYRSAVADDLRRIGSLAESDGIGIACEFHGGSLTDSHESALRLMEETEHENVKLYWQPPVELTMEECITSLKTVLPFLANLHVFHWSSIAGQVDRRSLEDGKERWREYFRLTENLRQKRWALLEFVKDNSPEKLLEDARTLTELLESIK